MEHIELINKIIESEQRAKAMAEEALRQRESLQVNLKETATTLHDTYFERADTRLAKVKEREAALAEEQIADLDEVFDNDMRSIETAFAENQPQWVEKLFQMIIN